MQHSTRVGVGYSVPGMARQPTSQPTHSRLWWYDRDDARTDSPSDPRGTAHHTATLNTPSSPVQGTPPARRKECLHTTSSPPTHHIFSSLLTMRFFFYIALHYTQSIRHLLRDSINYLPWSANKRSTLAASQTEIFSLIDLHYDSYVTYNRTV